MAIAIVILKTTMKKSLDAAILFYKKLKSSRNSLMPSISKTHVCVLRTNEKNSLIECNNLVLQERQNYMKLSKATLLEQLCKIFLLMKTKIRTNQNNFFSVCKPRL